MNTKILMIVSSIFMMISGLGLTFVPEEISEFLNAGLNQTSILFLQILGSLYLGFGMLNWMTKNILIGGIYNRPLVVSNLAHFLVTSFALIKIAGKYTENKFPIILTLTIIYTVLTLCFEYVFMKNPNNVSGTN
ncbi:hypothetical protein D2V08_12820 [Flagellimonas lutimaris]|uniref:Uncharacterized protein n=1 Tax=Flagellimonas lutimaris TaxID=475082 RepID=A0A3A1NAR2_9FLAO|nr:hypothetical protein [Allomuricauda lutimaris]RIV31636.1 hypothetical protein D2V08_12820 [Allomuricauda lutimaris]